MALKIHPGIGVARVGDSPELFIGPETVDLPGAPAGGYRDGEGRMRRQAARFRLFDDATHLTSAPGTVIQWTVHLQGGNASISGTNQIVSLMVGGDVAAELRTDAEGNLLVLSCLITGAASNGCCDGPVQATLTSGATTTPAVAGWVMIAPPDFAPGVYPHLPYTFLILDWLVVDRGLPTPAPGTNLSFRREIYPAVRGRSSLTPAELLALPTQAAREAAVAFYSAPNELYGDEGAYLHSIIEHFHTGHFVNDWATPTPLVPAELDRGPLCFVDGTCPGWGWELNFLPIDPGVHPIAAGETLRLDPAVAAEGVMSPFYGWMGDVGPCLLEWVTIAKSPATGFGEDWRVRGFMVQGGAGLVYRDWVGKFDLLTTQLDFGQVQRGSAVARLVQIEHAGYFVPATIQLTTPLPDGIQAPTLTTNTGFSPESGGTVTLPLLFSADIDAPLGPIPPASIELQMDGELRFIPIAAEIVEQSTTQLGLVVDCSSSMTEDRGDGLSKFTGLKQALEVLIDVARPNDGIAVAPFSDNALPTHTARSLGDGGPGDTARQNVRDFVDALETVNNTSIGDGLVSARNLLTRTPDSFDDEALIVITDGKETAPAYIENVASTIDQRTFAIGIGTRDNVNEDTLRALTTPRGGYLLLTGNSVSATNQYRLEKYLLQILAGANHDEVLLDPAGSVLPGAVARVPIAVTEADFRLDVIVVSDAAPQLLLALQGPDGAVRPFEALSGEPGAQIVRRRRVGMARVPTPLNLLDGHVWGPGTWYLLIAERGLVQSGASYDVLAAELAMAGRQAFAALPRGKPLSYAAVVNVQSALRLSAHATRLDGAARRLAIEATLELAGVPLTSAPSVVAEIQMPSGLGVELPLVAQRPGHYLGELEAVRPGTYVTRVRARGLSLAAHRFTRELTLTPSLVSEQRPVEPCRGQRDFAEKLRDCRAELKRIASCLLHGRPRQG